MKYRVFGADASLGPHGAEGLQCVQLRAGGIWLSEARGLESLCGWEEEEQSGLRAAAPTGQGHVWVAARGARGL